MSYFQHSFRALGTTVSNIFRKPVTVQFPEEVRPRTERYRTSFALPDDEHGEIACVACMACEKVCPSNVILVKMGPKRESPVTGKKRAYPADFQLDLSACIFCELCVQVCNSDSILMVRQPESPTFAREDLLLTLDRLRANAKDRQASWGSGTRLQEAQEQPKKEAPKKPAAEAAPAPAAAPAATPATAPTEAAAPAPAPAPATAPAGGENPS